MRIEYYPERGVTFPDGFKVSSVRAGLKTSGSDLGFIVSDRESTCAGVFTTNVVKAASVTYSQKINNIGFANAILVNAGNANACNGDHGDKDVITMSILAGNVMSVAPENILVAQTGIIGHKLPMDIVEMGISKLSEALSCGETADKSFSKAIMTTDLVPKQISAEVYSEFWEGPIKIGGSCKGSGMIAPNMATMLCFLTTDASISHDTLQSALLYATEKTFNRMTVDGDTSTNDMILCLANGASTVSITTVGAINDFQTAMESVCLHLAKSVAKDGEGATKLVKITAKNCKTEKDAEKVAKSIAESPLVKTALFGNDPNWGRILMAAGKSGVAFDFNVADVYLGEIAVFIQGTGAEFDHSVAHNYLKSDEVEIIINLNNGTESVDYYTCDFSYDYVKINAEYHT